MARLSGYAWGEVGRIVLLVHWQLLKISCDNTTRLLNQKQDQMCPTYRVVSCPLADLSFRLSTSSILTDGSFIPPELAYLKWC